MGKIAVSHFLNKNLKPKLFRGKKAYPLYIRIRFERRKTEIKSRYYDFHSQNDSDDLINELSTNNRESEILYLSSEEFEACKNDKKFEEERNQLFRLVEIYKNKGVNIISIDNTSEFVKKSLNRISECLSDQFKEDFKAALLSYNDYISLYQIINWDNSFVKIVKAIESLGLEPKSKFNSKIKKFVDRNYNILSAYKAFDDTNQYRIYQWESEVSKLFEDFLKKNLSITLQKRDLQNLNEIVTQYAQIIQS